MTTGQVMIVRTLRRAAPGVALVGSVLALTVAAVLVHGAVRRRSAVLLESPAVRELMAEGRRRPGDEQLREQIRELDLLARRAYFSGQAAARFGAVLLVVGVVVALGAVKLMRHREVPAPGVPAGPSGDEAVCASASRLAVGACGVALLAGGIALSGLPVTGPGRSAGGEVETAGAIAQAGGSTPAAASGTAAGAASGIAAGAASGIAAGAASGIATAEEVAREWPCFRGPWGLGVAPATAIPTRWDVETGENVVWKAAVPRGGFNSPVVWGDRLFLTGADASAREVFCFDAGTGALRWRRELSPAGALPEVTEDTGFGAATAATDGRRVFAIFATTDVAAWDLDGTLLWQRNLGLPENPYGHASSLMWWRDLLFVQLDQSGGGGRILALDVATGKTRWERPRDLEGCWATPAVSGPDDGALLVLSGNPTVIAYEAATGREVWRADCLGGEPAPSPAIAGTIAYLTTEYALLSARELTTGKELWSVDEFLPDVASPVATAEWVLLANTPGEVTAFAAQDGKVLWQREFAEGFYASPILVGERLLVTDRKGMTTVLRAGGDFGEVGRGMLRQSTVATPAVRGDRIYMRGQGWLYCLGTPRTEGGDSEGER